MKSGILDKNKKEVKKGDILVFPYVTPKGDVTRDEDFRRTVLFKYGCFGFETQTEFIPLMEWMDRKLGDYVPNCGNKVVYLETYPFWIADSE